MMTFKRLVFFPSPHDDELFYGVCSRYIRDAVHSSNRNACIAMFNRKSLGGTIELPTGLETLIQKLPPGSLTSDFLISKNTFFPLFRPFLTHKHCDSIVDILREGSKRRPWPILRGAFSQFSARRPFLRYCRKCIASDAEPYWHRSHQLYGVVICHKHKEALFESKISASLIYGSTAAPLSEEVWKNGTTLTYSLAAGHLYEISQAVYWMVNKYDDRRTDLERVRTLYQNDFVRLGYQTPTGWLDLDKLTKDFSDFYGKNIDEFLFPYRLSGCPNVLELITKHPTAQVHPLCHLLLILFLRGSCEEFFAQELGKCPIVPFGTPPWPCLNRTAPHYLSPVIESCVIKSDMNRTIVGTFTCSCGFTYSRIGPDRCEEDKHHFHQILTFGPIWEAELLRLREQELCSFAAISRRVGIAEAIVKLQYYRIKNMRLSECARLSLNSKRSQMRKRVLAFKKACKNNSRGEFMKLDISTYQWLQKYDGKWFNHVLPALSKKKRSV